MKWQYIVIVFVLCNFVRYVIQLRKKEGIIIDLWAYNHIAVWLWYFNKTYARAEGRLTISNMK